MANRLQRETSPYLLQHAENPVDWYPWGEEAFDRARAENKPIFLSIGYSTCHWCHVMERESFEDPRVAAVLNENFVSIKVDREELPHVDHLYMGALTQVMGQAGGWPLSLWLTPDRKPFFGGTYFPPRDSHGRPSFRRVIDQLALLWKQRREDLEQDAGKIFQYLESIHSHPSSTSISLKDQDLLASGTRMIVEGSDRVFGGFGTAPKFPQSSLMELLLWSIRWRGDQGALECLERQLVAMANGGIFDHVGGGFARYSTDERWFAPHFEKMLYDNGLLLGIYAQAHALSPRPLYEKVMKKTASYLLQQMRNEEGAFYAAEDADSEGVEGKFYVWDHAQVLSLLGADGQAFCDHFQLKPEGNWHDPHGENLLKNILHRPKADDWQKDWEPCLKKLFDEREKRVKPLRDEKILFSWNAMAISGLCLAGRCLENQDWIRGAQQAAAFLEKNMTHGDLLHRSFCGGSLRGEGTLEDYAFYENALMDLHQATGEEKYAERAGQIHRVTRERFGGEGGDFYLTTAGQSGLGIRTRAAEDGAVPGAGAMALLNLARRAQLTEDPTLKTLAEGGLGRYSEPMVRSPHGHATLVLATCWLGLDSGTVKVHPAKEGSGKVLRWIRSRVEPGISILEDRGGTPPGSAVYCGAGTCYPPFSLEKWASETRETFLGKWEEYLLNGMEQTES